MLFLTPINPLIMSGRHSSSRSHLLTVLVSGQWTSGPANSISLGFACFFLWVNPMSEIVLLHLGTSAVAVGLEGGQEGPGNWHLYEVCFLNLGVSLLRANSMFHTTYTWRRLTYKLKFSAVNGDEGNTSLGTKVSVSSFCHHEVKQTFAFGSSRTGEQVNITHLNV